MPRPPSLSRRALLIPGSGPTDRNSDVLLPAGRRLRGAVTAALAEALGCARVATLRFDKRGVGASGGDYLSTGMDRRYADVRAARDWLAAKAAGLPQLAIGHSEGSSQAADLRVHLRLNPLVSAEVLGLLTEWVTRHWGTP
jgi:uncharacterized protein